MLEELLVLGALAYLVKKLIEADQQNQYRAPTVDNGVERRQRVSAEEAERRRLTRQRQREEEERARFEEWKRQVALVRASPEWATGKRQLEEWLGRTQREFRHGKRATRGSLVVAIDMEAYQPELVHIASDTTEVKDRTGNCRVETPGRLQDTQILSVAADSPVGYALLGAKPDDIVTVHAPAGIYQYFVCEVVELER
jgi:hypothetical protein